ncbi:MAG: hypothetical protein JNK82_26715 [Myxococcaceae bacterium]|nr:hypothetical protein [Myxococcaceae bacterium]
MTERDLKDQAHRRMTRGDVGGALDTYKQLIVMNGKEPAYRLRHAELSQRLGREDAAVGSYRVAALLLSKGGRLAQAKAALHSAVRLAPKDLSLRRELKELLDAQSGPAFSGPPVLGADELETEPCLLPVLE